MAQLELHADTGRDRGTGSARRLRRTGHIPAVVYGHGIEATPVAVEARALRAALSTEAGLNAVITLHIEGTEHLAMAKDVQRHPVRGTVAHVDFLVVNRNETVTVDVPVVLVGEPSEVNAAGGVINHELFTLSIHTTPARIPNSIEADISGLTVGGVVRVGDLRLPPGCSTDVDPEAPVVSAQAQQAEVLPEAAEGEAPAEGEAAAGQAGEGGEGGGEEAAANEG